jgi:anti-sigma28 factor (negative regulator of flagellin synthesis)
VKIENRPSPEPVNVDASRAEHKRRKASTPVPAEDQAAVSDLAKAALEANGARIAELQRLYERGEYSVPAQELAARILDAHTKEKG